MPNGIQKHLRLFQSGAQVWGNLMLAAILQVTAAPCSAAERTLAIADLPAFSSALIAEAEGYFSAEGLSLHILHCPNGKRCLTHLLDGDAHYATVADTPLVLASFGRSPPFSIVATIATAARENRLIARLDRGIQKSDDLKGKRIGTVMGTSAQFFLDSFLLYHGISPSQVSVIGLNTADAHMALARGDVDAIGIYQPYGHLAQKELGTNARVLANPKLYSVTINLVATTAKNGATDGDTIKLLRALLRANALIASEPERARRIVSSRLRLDPQLLGTIWADYDFALQLGQPLIAALEAQARWAVRARLVPNQALPDYLDYINPGPLRAVAPRTVTLVK